MLDGKVAFITGGARGQGRAHAVTCAREGADVIIVDVIEQLPTDAYQLATKDDLDESVRLVEAHDRRAVAVKAGVSRSSNSTPQWRPALPSSAGSTS